MTETEYNNYKTSFYNIYSDLQHAVACKLKYGISCTSEMEALQTMFRYKKTLDAYDYTSPDCVTDDTIKTIVTKAKLLKFKKATCSEPVVQTTQGESPSIPAEIQEQYAINEKSSNIWYFGAFCGLDFSEGEPTVLSDSAMDQGEGCAVLSDANGNLVAYTDGVNLYDRNHNFVKWDNGNDVSAAGTPMKGDPSSSQSAIVATIPDQPGKYLIITAPERDNETHYFHYTFDARKNAGLGELSNEVNITIGTGLTEGFEGMCLIQHANGKDWWVILSIRKTAGGSELRVHQLTSSGFNLTPTATFAHTNNVENVGQIKGSFNNDKIAFVVYSTQQNNSFCMLYDFNNTTGTISNPVTVVNKSVYSRLYSCEFSPNDNHLYISTAYTTDVMRILVYNITTNTLNILGTKDVTGYDGQTYNTQLQYAPNGKIYFPIGRSWADEFNHINDPNLGYSLSGGATITWYDDPNALTVTHDDNSYPKTGLPYFPKSYF